MKRQQLNIPRDERHPNSGITTPYVCMGDEAYPLLENLIKPYARVSLHEENKVFNKELSPVPKTIVCTLRILTMKWKILSKAIETFHNTV